jgi:hypothetical protein
MLKKTFFEFIVSSKKEDYKYANKKNKKKKIKKGRTMALSLSTKRDTEDIKYDLRIKFLHTKFNTFLKHIGHDHVELLDQAMKIVKNIPKKKLIEKAILVTCITVMHEICPEYDYEYLINIYKTHINSRIGSEHINRFKRNILYNDVNLNQSNEKDLIYKMLNKFDDIVTIDDDLRDEIVNDYFLIKDKDELKKSSCKVNSLIITVIWLKIKLHFNNVTLTKYCEIAGINPGTIRQILKHII